MPRLSLLLFILLASAPAWAAQTVRIGILSHRGTAATLARWQPTARYLEETLADTAFQIVPLDFSEVPLAVARSRVDFILVNSGIYVDLEVRYRVSRIATLNNRRGDRALNRFGGVIFVRRGRQDLRDLDDLRGRTFLAVDQASLGGFQMAWRVFHEQGIDPYRDFRRLDFAGTHDAVVLGVLHGKADAGTVRSDILERMAAAGRIRLRDFRVLHLRSDPDFPFLHSTRLYPEWPFSKLRHTPNALAQRVAVALLSMPPDHPAAVAGQYAGWTIPLDYQPVHDLFRALHLPPYDQEPEFTLQDALARYWPVLLLGLSAFLVVSALSAWAIRLNRHLARAKRRLEQRHELILNSVADGIYGVDLEGNSTFVNRAMERITGWSAQELIGRNQHEVLHHTRANGRPHPPEQCPVYAAYRDNRPRFVEDDLFWRSDGSAFPVEYSATPLQDEHGRTLGSVVVFRDITERKRAREQARLRQQELTRVARLSTLGEMASGIAHELNQPLTAITTNARACVRLMEAGRAAHLGQCGDILDKIAGQAERAGEVIRQIRRLARKEAPERKPLSLSGLIRGILVFIEPDAARAEVDLKVTFAVERDQVLVQGLLIEQVILNLTRNAIEALSTLSGRGRRLTLGTRPCDHTCIECFVEDNGPGLPPEVRDRLFEPFVTTKAEGMGLGLSISSGILSAHGSRLEMDTPAEGGTRFHFRLPLADVRSES